MARRTASGTEGDASAAWIDESGERGEALSIAIETGESGEQQSFLGDAARTLLGGGDGDSSSGDSGAAGPRRRGRRAGTKAAKAEAPGAVDGERRGSAGRIVRNAVKFVGHFGHKSFFPPGTNLYTAGSFWEYDRDELDIAESLSNAAFKGSDLEDMPPKVAIACLAGFGVITLGTRIFLTQQLIKAVQAQNAAAVQAQGMAPSAAMPGPGFGGSQPSESDPADAAAYVPMGKRTQYNDLMSDLQAAG